MTRRAAHGDRAAFGEIVRRHQQAVFNVAYRLLGNRQDAEDAAQELARWISALKQALPAILFVGAIPAQTLARVEYNPITGRTYSAEETWG
ncbi:MAG: sigma factor [Chloroflexia bacterium]